jgi:hypothetical protein
MNQAEIEAYIAQLPYNDPFTSLPAELREQIVFGSLGMLRRRFGEAILTVEMAALQSLYVAEGEGEEFAKFKRQGVKSMGMDGMSFSFEGGNISPEVTALVEQITHPDLEGGGVFFGRLM